MRIIGGQKKNHILKTPLSDAIRPTSDKVRLAIFNALFSRAAVREAVVIDAFCGTGALGCEALSQGAARALFFDVSKASLDLTQENIRSLGFDSSAQCFLKDVSKLDARPETTPPATLVFLDPPYRKNLIIPTLLSLQTGGWLAAMAWIVIESEKEWALPAPIGTIDTEKNYGATKIQFLKYQRA